MLSNLNWPTLAMCRNEQKATMLFKIISHQIDINADDFLFPNPNLHHTQWRIQDGAFGANAPPPPPPLQEIAYKIEIL